MVALGIDAEDLRRLGIAPNYDEAAREAFPGRLTISPAV
jgi:hypothetical protein